ncbi:MAG: hypothetical protein V3V19_02165 [Cocleimonas sp.]
MKVISRNQIFLKIVSILCLSIVSVFLSQATFAEDIDLPLARIIATQSVTKLEVISTVKTLIEDGRVLSIKKKSSYSNPDCHHVKVLGNDGELQNIKLGCFLEKIAQKTNK